MNKKQVLALIASSFLTLPLAVSADTLSVKITSPALNATPAVAGKVIISAVASSTGTIAGVQFKIDNTKLGSEITKPPYTIIWNSASTTNGWHIITAYARTAAGSIATSSVSVKVINTPYLSASLAPGTHRFGAPYTLYLAASTSIRYRQDSTLALTCSSGSIYSTGITFSTSTIIRALACNGAKPASSVTTYAYDVISTASYTYGGRIVVVGPAAATSTILKPAVADLQKHLKQMNGTDYYLGQYTTIFGIQLYLTTSPGVPADAVSQLAGKGFEAFVIRGDSTQLKIIANNERGLAHGIYYYLENRGVRWLMAGSNWTIVPRANVTVTIDKLVVPAFSLNRMYAGTGGYFSNAFGRKYTGSAEFQTDLVNWNRRLRFSHEYHLGKSMGEAFVQQNVDTLKAHPEYLAKVDGAYTPLYLPDGKLNIIAKLNAGNPEAVNYYCDWIMKGYRAQRKTLGIAASTMSVEPSDGSGEGNNIAELVAAGVGDGSSSDQEFFIINACARKLKAEFPDASAISLAYAAHSDPPTFPLEKNVFIQPAFAFRGSPKTKNLTNGEWVTLWGTKATALALYNYWSIPDWTHDEPTFDYLAVGDLLRSWYGKNIKGTHAESTYSMGAMGLGHYVSSHLMWDPNQNENALIEEWYTLAFGPAKAPMKRMLERWSKDYRPISAELGLAYKDIKEAEQLAAANPAVQARVDDYARYIHYLRLRVEMFNTTSSSSKRQKASETAEFLFDANNSRMMSTTRDFDLLAFRGYSELLDEFYLHNPAKPDDKPNGPGWARVAPLSHAAVMNLINDGAVKYPVPDFTTKKYTGDLVPLQPISWQASTTTDPWGVLMVTAADTDVALEIPNGLSKFPLRVSLFTDIEITITNTSGNTVYKRMITANTSPGTLLKPVMEELNIPLAVGQYKVHFHVAGRGTYRYQTWRGIPITILSPFLAPKAGQGIIPQLYFYVPTGQSKIVMYLPDGDSGAVLMPKFYNPDGVFVSADRRDNGKVYVVSVAAGQDGKVWSVKSLVTPNFAQEMLTTPQTFSLEPQVLKVPSDAMGTVLGAYTTNVGEYMSDLSLSESLANLANALIAMKSLLVSWSQATSN